MRLIKRNDREHDEQATVIEWANLKSLTIPELSLLYAIPNAGSWRGKPFITKGGKHLPPLQAVRFKREGVKAGVPDLCLPVARRNCNALYIEMKADGNKPTAMQKVWHESLRAFGNCVKVCYSAEEAIKVLEWYLE